MYCDLALAVDPEHVKSKFRKAKSLAYLFEFEESIDLFRSINSKQVDSKKEIEVVN
jgi:hypothetical protein